MSSIGDQFYNSLKQYHAAGEEVIAQFNDLPEFLQKKVIAKTIIVAALVGLGTSYLLGTGFAVITFTATAGAVFVRTVDRLSAAGVVAATMKEFGHKGWTETKHTAKAAGMGFVRGAEDLFDVGASFFRSDKENQQKESKKQIKRGMEDVTAEASLGWDRFLTDFRLTMTL